MALVNPLSSTTSPKDPSGTSKEEILVDPQDLLPEVVLIQNIRAEDFGSYAAGQVFQCFTGETALDRSVVL